MADPDYGAEAFLSSVEQDIKKEGALAPDYERERERRRRRHREDNYDDRYDERRSSHRSSRRSHAGSEHGDVDHERERERKRRHRDDDRRRSDHGDDVDRRPSRRDYDRYDDRYDARYDDRYERRRRDRYDDRYDRGGYDRYDRGGNDDIYESRRGGSSRDWRDDPRAGGASPARRSPTPPDTIPISQRMRKMTEWDIKPPGFEHMSAMQAKATGLFGMPGQSRTQLGAPTPQLIAAQAAAGYNVAQVAGMLPPIHMGRGVSGGPSGGGSAPNANMSRQARRLYVGNITYEATEQIVCDFFNSKMKDLNMLSEPEGNPVISAQVNHEKSYAFIEFRHPDEATKAMSFDGIVFQSQSLKIRRPKDYVGPDVLPPPNIHVPGVVSTNVPDSPNKIFIGGLPSYLNDEQVMELLKSFGELRAFNLVKEAHTGQSKGFAFCEYVDPSLTDIACQGLNGMELGDRRLVVQRASIGANPNRGGPGGGPTGANSAPLPPALARAAPSLANGEGAGEPQRAMQMLNMVTPEELLDDQEYEDILEDVRDECAKFGTVLDVRIPRPAKQSKSSNAQRWKSSAELAAEEEAKAQGGGEEKEREAVGRVYVKYETVEQCAAALRSIAGRQFGGRLVICAFLPPEDWPSEEDGGETKEGQAASAAAAAAAAEAAAAEPQPQAGEQEEANEEAKAEVAEEETAEAEA